MTQHNDEIIEEAIEEATADYDNNDAEEGEETGEEAAGGLLPFISPVFTIAMFAAAGLVASLKNRKD